MWLYSDQWAAGFFDGEGCIQIEPRASGGYTSYYVNLAVAQNDRRPLMALQEKFGGQVKSASRSAGDQCSRWRVSNRGAEAFLIAVLPHLLVKREQAEIALELRALVGSRGDKLTAAQRQARRDVYEKFRRTFAR